MADGLNILLESVKMINAWDQGFQVHIQLLCFISNYFCKNLVFSPKLRSYQEAIVAFWKKLSVSIFAT